MCALASSVPDRPNWQLCGYVRPAIKAPTQYRVAESVLHMGIRVRDSGDVLCACPSPLPAPKPESVELIIPLIETNRPSSMTLVVQFIDPCMVAVCQHGDPFQFATAPLAVHVRPPPCGPSLQVYKAGRNIVLNTETDAAGVHSHCTESGQYGILLISHASLPTNPGDPSLVITQNFPLDLSTCLGSSSMLVSLHRINSSQPQNYPPPLVIQKSRIVRQSNQPPEFDSQHYTPIGTVVTTVAASDPDTGSLGEVTYSFILLDSNRQNLFSLDSDTGVMTTTGWLVLLE